MSMDDRITNAKRILDQTGAFKVLVRIATDLNRVGQPGLLIGLSEAFGHRPELRAGSEALQALSLFSCIQWVFKAGKFDEEWEQGLWQEAFLQVIENRSLELGVSGPDPDEQLTEAEHQVALHPEFSVQGTVTGRLSSHEPPSELEHRLGAPRSQWTPEQLQQYISHEVDQRQLEGQMLTDIMHRHIARGTLDSFRIQREGDEISVYLRRGEVVERLAFSTTQLSDAFLRIGDAVNTLTSGFQTAGRALGEAFRTQDNPSGADF